MNPLSSSASIVPEPSSPYSAASEPRRPERIEDREEYTFEFQSLPTVLSFFPSPPRGHKRSARQRDDY